jgi:hypothetical protein
LHARDFLWAKTRILLIYGVILPVAFGAVSVQNAPNIIGLLDAIFFSHITAELDHEKSLTAWRYRSGAMRSDVDQSG